MGWILSTKVGHSLEFGVRSGFVIQTIPLELVLFELGLFTAAINNQCFIQDKQFSWPSNKEQSASYRLGTGEGFFHILN